MADKLMTIDPSTLEVVTGGRYTQGPDTIKPQVVQAIGELAKAVAGVGQGLAAVKQQSEGQKLQFFQQMMQMRGGR